MYTLHLPPEAMKHKVSACPLQLLFRETPQKVGINLAMTIPIVVGKWHVQVVGETVLAAQFHTSAKHWKDGGGFAPFGWG